MTPEQWNRVRTHIDAKNARTSKGRGRPPKGTHIFPGGILHCICGASMRPRTHNSGSGAYVCSGAAENGSSCAFGPLPQEAVDGPFLRSFAERYVDVDATRRTVVERVERERTLAREARVAAERQLVTVEAKQQLAEADYLAGDLSAKRYERMADRLDEETAAAQAEVRRLTAREAEVGDRLDRYDAEEGMLHDFAAVHNAVSGRLDGATLAAVRAAVSTLFDRVDVWSRVPDMAQLLRIAETPAAATLGGRHDDLVFGGDVFLRLSPRLDAVDAETGIRPAALRLEPTMAQTA